MTKPLSARYRSWLFAPGDSDRKIEKALGGAADQVILDLEDAVAHGEKDAARRTVAAALAGAGEGRHARMVGNHRD